MLTALTRPLSPNIDRCALTFMARDLIDLPLALRQHGEYENTLRALGLSVQTLPAEPDMPDAVFVEDAAVVVDEIAIITYPALPSRQCERKSIAEALAPYRPLQWISGDGRLEGGDVLRVGKALYVGLSRRTNMEGIRQLQAFLGPSYRVIAVPVPGCLHLKTGATALDERTLLANTAWVGLEAFADWDILPVVPGEDFAANVLVFGDAVLMPSNFPRTAEMIEKRGYRIHAVDLSELKKAEAGVTCCSIVFQP